MGIRKWPFIKTIYKHLTWCTENNRTVYNYQRYSEYCTTTCYWQQKKDWQHDWEGLAAN